MTNKIRRIVVKVMTDQTLSRCLVFAVAIVAGLVVNGPISGGGGV